MSERGSQGIKAFLAGWQRRATDASRWRDAFTRNLGLKAFSLVLAAGLWVFVNLGARDTEAAYKVRLVLENIPTGLVVTGPRIDDVDLRLVGSRTQLDAVERQDLELALDLTGVRAGAATFAVSVDGLNLPRGVRVLVITPSQVTLQFERLAKKSVPVQFSIENQPSSDFVVTQTAITPDRVVVSGPESVLREVEFVATEALDLANASPGSLEQEVALEAPAPDTTLDRSKVSAAVRIEDVLAGRTLDDVPVQPREPITGRLSIYPSTVSVTVEGSQRLVRGLALESVVAWVGPPVTGSGSFALEPEIRVPAGVRVLSVSPRFVEVSVAMESDEVGEDR